MTRMAQPADDYLRERTSGIQVSDYLPRVLPSSWRLLQQAEDGAAYQRDGLHVIVSLARELDERKWMHLSCSRGMRLPSWKDMCDAKDLFIGDRYAYQVFPSRADYVNINPNVLHLWAPLEGERPLPDFTHGRRSI